MGEMQRCLRFLRQIKLVDFERKRSVIEVLFFSVQIFWGNFFSRVASYLFEKLTLPLLLLLGSFFSWIRKMRIYGFFMSFSVKRFRRMTPATVRLTLQTSRSLFCSSRLPPVELLIKI
jgi:hypothetical protein